MDLDSLLEKNLPWAEIEDAGDVIEKALMETRALNTDVRYKVPVSKKGYVELV